VFLCFSLVEIFGYGMFSTMKTLQIDLPEQLAEEVEKAVRSGWFHDSSEVVREALRAFIASRQFEILEQQQLEDVAWALREKAPRP